jgi:hypothetical protein
MLKIFGYERFVFSDQRNSFWLRTFKWV